MISDLLEALSPDKYLQIREAFEGEFTYSTDILFNGTLYFVGVNIPDEIPTLGREGHYAYGTK